MARPAELDQRLSDHPGDPCRVNPPDRRSSDRWCPFRRRTGGVDPKPPGRALSTAARACGSGGFPGRPKPEIHAHADGGLSAAGFATPIGAWAEVVGSPYFWQTWGHLLHSVRTGENAFQDLNGQDVWKYRAEHPADSATFNRAMTQFSRGHAESVIGAYDFSAFRRIVDVGGGQGLMLAAILGAYPRMNGTLFDQPGVVAGARAALAERGVIDRCDVVGGSFFEAVPEGGDAYLMRVVIYDWEDDEAIAILKVCRRAMRAAKLLLIERIVAPPNEMPAIKFSDLNMLVSPGGRERTREEFSDLLARSGFELTCVVPAGTLNVLEALPR